MSRSTRDATAYNTAYLEEDRSALAAEWGLDPALDRGAVDPETGERVAPPDLDERRRAVLQWYGHRCGRCARPVAASEPSGEATLGYAFSVGRVAGAVAPWELSRLVALCQGCFDLLEPGEVEAVGTVATRYHRAPQFPAWLCDPRVAVERVPLTGRELFVRERSDRAVGQQFDFGVNEPVAEHAALALPTPAARAVALGEHLLAARTRGPATDQLDPERAWEVCSEAERHRYRARVLTPREAATADRWWKPPGDESVDVDEGSDARQATTQ